MNERQIISQAERREACNVAFLKLKASLPWMEELRPAEQRNLKALFENGFMDGCIYMLQKNLDEMKAKT